MPRSTAAARDRDRPSRLQRRPLPADHPGMDLKNFIWVPTTASNGLPVAVLVLGGTPDR